MIRKHSVVVHGDFAGPLGALVIVLGVILLLLGFFLHISILWTIGVILLIVGVVLFLLGRSGRAIGGRNHWY
jgi:membrane-bound ClpP family serine protease